MNEKVTQKFVINFLRVTCSGGGGKASQFVITYFVVQLFRNLVMNVQR